MGLFSFAKGILKAVPIVGSAISASDTSKAIKKANAATQAGIANATNVLSDQFGQTKDLLNPYITGGTNAFGAEQDILGLNGGGQQAAAITALQSSPLFQSLMRNGQDILLNNASATGGLRGGNLQRGLADFSADTLSQVIQQQLQNLGGISGQGLTAANALGAFGGANATALANLATGAGQANAGSILGQQQNENNAYSGIRDLVDSKFGVTDSLTNMVKGLFNGSGSIFSGAGSGYGANGGSLPNFPQINIALPSSSAGLPGF